MLVEGIHPDPSSIAPRVQQIIEAALAKGIGQSLCLIQIIEKKIELAGIDYANEKYDEVEDELHEIEDAFIDTYGDELEEVISKVYKKISPKSDVMLPIAYIAKEYHKIEIESGVDYKPLDEEGVPVDIQGFEDQDTRLVFVPSCHFCILKL